ncbi:MAG: tetratricopeptide repeat protein [Planctomycetota bacterium]
MRIALTISAVFVLASLSSAQEVRPYDGKYAAHPHFPSFAEVLPAKIRKAALDMAGRLGLPPGDASNVVLELVDRPLGPNKQVQLGGTATKTVNGKTMQWITLNPESHFAPGGDFDIELDHEMTHALLRTALGNANHLLLPKWAREGLAVWAAGQGPGRLAFWLTIHWEKPDPVAALLNGLEADKHSLEDYPEDYFAIAAIESVKGLAGVRAFVKDLASGRSCHDSAAAASGMSWEEFEPFARAYSEVRILEALGKTEPALLKRAIKLYRGGRDWEAAQRALFAISVRFPDSWAGALATYYFGRALQQAGLATEAREALGEFLAMAGPRTGLMDDAIWNIGLCCETTGDAEGAIAAFDRLARDYSYSPQAPAGLLKAAGICEAVGRKDEARTRWSRIVKDLAGTKEAEEANKKLGK